MKRIIFSLYRNDLDDHASVPDIKRQQFAKYADQLENKQRAYADLCGADYKIFKPNINTGVLLMNSDCIANLNFAERSVEAVLTFDESLEDSLYMPEMTKSWALNNEVILSYIIEKDNLPFTNIGMSWNFIVDHNEQQITSAAHFLHVVHKKFDLYFG